MAKRRGVEDMEEFDRACKLSSAYCKQMTEEEYEDLTISETEKALQDLMEYMDKNPSVYKRVLQKKKKEDLENEGILSYIKVKVKAFINGEDSVAMVTDGECQEKMSRLTIEMAKAHDYNLESKGRRTSQRLAEKRQASQSSIVQQRTSTPRKKAATGNLQKKTVLKTSQNTAPAPPPPPPPPPPPLVVVENTNKEPSSNRTPLRTLNGQINTPQSLMKCSGMKKSGSVTSLDSLDSVGSLSSLHQELLSYDPMKRLKTTDNNKSPGGTPVKPRRPLRENPTTPLTQADTFYKHFLTSIHHKFKNVLSPGSGLQSPTSGPNSPGFTP